MTNYPDTNSNKSLPLVEIKPGKMSALDLLVAVPCAAIGAILLILPAVVLLGFLIWKPVQTIQSVRGTFTPQRNPFA